jgi:hypothetical protein
VQQWPSFAIVSDESWVIWYGTELILMRIQPFWLGLCVSVWLLIVVVLLYGCVRAIVIAVLVNGGLTRIVCWIVY